ncbi:MAG: hypothetical protein PHY16_16785 [Methylobacter sp.]|nr:hypothetical protein [Methylobacter sp.]
MNKVTVSPFISGIRKLESSAEFQRMIQAIKRQQQAEQRMRPIDHSGNSRNGDLAVKASTQRRLRSIEDRTERF